MYIGKAAQKCATNSVALDRVLQCYVLAGLFSTSGVDVLLAMTLAFLLFVSVRETVVLLSAGFSEHADILGCSPKGCFSLRRKRIEADIVIENRE